MWHSSDTLIPRLVSDVADAPSRGLPNTPQFCTDGRVHSKRPLVNDALCRKPQTNTHPEVMEASQWFEIQYWVIRLLIVLLIKVNDAIHSDRGTSQQATALDYLAEFDKYHSFRHAVHGRGSYVMPPVTRHVHFA
jgi:hypothetical protein